MANRRNESERKGLVKLVIPAVPGDKNENVQIGVNGKTWLIPRGEEVEVPDFVAEEYYRSYNMQMREQREKKKLAAQAKTPQ